MSAHNSLQSARGRERGWIKSDWRRRSFGTYVSVPSGWPPVQLIICETITRQVVRYPLRLALRCELDVGIAAGLDLSRPEATVARRVLALKAD